MVSSAPFQAGQSLQRYKDKEERLLLPFVANADGNNPFILISNIKHPPETMVKCRGWSHIFGTMERGCLIWTGDGTSYEPFCAAWRRFVDLPTGYVAGKRQDRTKEREFGQGLCRGFHPERFWTVDIRCYSLKWGPPKKINGILLMMHFGGGWGPQHYDPPI
jgi:hypothetical protein